MASDKVYQLLARGRWFFPGNPASSTTKTGRHDIAESGVKHKKSNKINLFWTLRFAWPQRILVCLISKNCLGNLAFWQWSIDYGGTWWRLVQKRIVHTKFVDLRFIWRWLSERVNDCCLAPLSYFSAILWREQVKFQWDDEEDRFVLDQHA